jgi:hypothetical protein
MACARCASSLRRVEQLVFAYPPPVHASRVPGVFSGGLAATAADVSGGQTGDPLKPLLDIDQNTSAELYCFQLTRCDALIDSGAAHTGNPAPVLNACEARERRNLVQGGLHRNS